jgi:O-antigen/teichoic acid export membrane protein
MLAENVAYALGMGGCGVVLALSGCGVWSLVYATLALKLSRLGLLRYLGEHVRRGSWCVSDALQLLRVGLGFSLGRVLNFFSLQGDNFVVGRLLGVDALGMYSRAYQLMTLPAMYVGQVFEKVMFPAMAKTQGNHAKLAREFLVTLEAITLVALPAGGVMYFFASEIVHVLFGPRWSAVVPVVSIISFGMFFRTAYKCSDTVVRSVGAVYHYAARQALYTILVLTGAYVGSLVSGLEGVALGVVGAVALNYLSMTTLCVRLVGVSWSSIASAHLSGIWVTTVLITGLCIVTPTLRGLGLSPTSVLVIGCIVSGVLWAIGLLVASMLFPSGFLVRLSRFIAHSVTSDRSTPRDAAA